MSIVVLCVCFSLAPDRGKEASAATLAAPTLSYAARTYDTITLKWTAVSGAQSYVLYQYSNADLAYKRIAVVKAGTTLSFKVTGLTKATTYKFVVRAAQTSTGTTLGYTSAPLSVTTLYPKTYRIYASSLPVNKNMLNYGYYTAQTRQYYTIRSYLEWFEACGGGKLILSPGTYTITNTLYVPSNVTIVLEDGAKLVKGLSTGSALVPSRSMFQLVRPSKALTVGAYGVYNGEANISFIGYGTASVDMRYQSNALCIMAGHNQNVTISGIDFRNLNNGHFIEMDATKNASVRDCGFYNITGDNLREAINLDTPDKITGGFTAVWTKYDCTANTNVRIENCRFSGMARAVGTHNYSGSHTHNDITVANCTMTNMRSYAINMMNWYGATVTGNTLTGSAIAVAEEKSGILGLGVKNCTITGNRISTYYRGMLFMPWQGTSPEEIAAYPMIYNEFGTENLAALAKNSCAASVTQPRVLFIHPDGSTGQILLPVN